MLRTGGLACSVHFYEMKPRMLTMFSQVLPFIDFIHSTFIQPISDVKEIYLRLNKISKLSAALII